MMFKKVVIALCVMSFAMLTVGDKPGMAINPKEEIKYEEKEGLSDAKEVVPIELLEPILSPKVKAIDLLDPILNPDVEPVDLLGPEESAENFDLP